MTFEMRVVIVGPAFVGRKSTLAWIVGQQLRSKCHEVAVRLARDAVDVRVCANHLREWYVYQDPRDPKIAPELREEIENTVRADGVLFVADTLVQRQQLTVQALSHLRRDLETFGRDVDEIPVCFFINELDNGETLEPARVEEVLHVKHGFYARGNVKTGRGVREAFTELVRVLAARRGP